MSRLSPRYTSHQFASAVAVSLSLLGSLSTNAATLTWNGTSTDFESATNWGGTAPTSDLTTNIALFTGAVTGNAPTITVSRSISGLDFESAGWTLGGSSGKVLTIGASGIVSVGSGTNTISANVAVGAAQTWSISAGNTLLVSGTLTGSSALTLGGTGTLVLGASNSYAGAVAVNSGTLRLGSSQTFSSTVTIGGGSSTAVLDLAAYKLTLGTGKTLTINSSGTLLLSNTTSGVTSGIVGNVAVNSGGIIQVTNNVNSNAANNIYGDVTLNSGATISSNSTTANGATGYLGRITITGNFTANAGSTIATNENGFLIFTGTNVYIDSGVTLAKGVIAGRTAVNMLTFAKGSGTQTLTSNSALDSVFVRDLESVGSNATTILNVGAISGGNIGQLYINNIDPNSTTTVRLANNLTVIAGKGIINQNTGSTSGSNAAVAFDLNGYTYDASAASTGWAPNTTGTVTASPWTILSTSGTGTFRASSFTLTGTSTDVTIGSNVIFEATASGSTTDLGIKTGGTGTIAATSTFLFAAGGNHYLKSTNNRTIGNLVVGNASTSSTLSLSSAITTGSGSSVTVKDGSELATGSYNLTTTGAVNIGDAKISGNGTGTFSVAGTITATGAGNATISAPIALTGTGSSQEIAVTNATANLTISGAISGAAKGITKTGAGAATLTGVSTYTGATIIDAGILSVNGSLASSSAVNIHSGATLSGSGTVGGTVIGTSATINGNGLTLGATTLYGTSTVNGYNIASSVTVAGGTTTLSGTTKSTNALSVAAGATLSANGTIDGSANVSGLLKGNSTVTGNLALTSGTLAPGNSPGITTVTGDFTTDALSTLVAEVSGTVAGTSYDQVKVSGVVTLAGTLDLSTLSGLTMGSTITLIDNIGSGTTTGYFSTIITSGSTYTVTSNSNYTFTAGGTEYLLSYNASSAESGSSFNDVTLTVVPEPGTWAMLVGGIGMLAFSQRLRRRANV
ncbi:MAG: beta strand repeat-containing protein [Chthoniobacteraceae bacterium]